MTDTLPSWAIEQAREVALRWFHPSMVGHVRLRDAIATALTLAYQQGKQDGQREMREQDAKVAAGNSSEFDFLTALEECRDSEYGFHSGRLHASQAIRALGGSDAG